MEYKLEITSKLERMAKSLDRTIAILNLPGANYCEKRAELIERNGKLEQACKGCISQTLTSKKRLSIKKVREVIDFFAQNYGTEFITVNGRGDPFHPKLKQETLEKIRYAASKGMRAYIFTAGNNLDEETCKFLAKYKVNLTLSWFGNQFLDADFFRGKQYPSSQPPIQNQAKIAEGFRRLIQIYQTSPQPEEGTTRICINYVVSKSDLADETKLHELREAVDANRISLICNTNFEPNPNPGIQKQLEQLALKYSSYHLVHSTAVNNQCQMGAASSATVDFDGGFHKCPYQRGKGDGNFTKMSEIEKIKILSEYIKNRGYACVMRKTRV